VPALAALLLALPFAAQGELRTLSPEEMRADLFLLGDTLASQHAGLHRYTDAAELDELLGRELEEVGEEPRDVLWFYRHVCEVLSAIHCGHTRAQLPQADLVAAAARRGLLPLELHWSGTRAWIVRVLDDGVALRPGAELVSIDGLTPAEIRARAFARLSGDGAIESGKERELAWSFPELYSQLVSEAEGPYRVAVAGLAAPLAVTGLAPAVFDARRAQLPRRPPVHFELGDDGVGVLTVATFADPGGGEPGFLAALESAFRSLREHGAKHLVLDLRGNGGGRDMYGAALVSYLASKPFGYFERIEVTPDYQPGGAFQLEERDGRRLMLSHPGLAVQEPAELHFSGDVQILIDGWTFSTAADVATVAHHLHLATFLGEETGGGYDGNTSGDGMMLALPNSHVSVHVPKWMYTTANLGHAHSGRGVPPDVPLVPSIEDVLAGRDVVLAKALERARARPDAR